MNLKKIMVLLAATAMLAACNANANNNKPTSEDPASDNPSEASEDAFVATIDVTDSATKAYLAYLIGYGVNYGSYVTAATVEIARDATELNFNVTFGGGEELFSITEFGTAANEEIETFVENFEYVPEEPTWPAEDIATLFKGAGFTDDLGDTIYVSPDDAFAVQLYDISGATVEIDIYVV